MVILLCGYYYFLFAYFKKGWEETNEFHSSDDNILGVNEFSIIVPARNEEARIAGCLEDLFKQGYNPNDFEIILVDDFSEDNTVSIALEMASRHPKVRFSIIKLADYFPCGLNSYKKLGIDTAISQSIYPWIITTDADCRRGNNWLNILNEFIIDNDFVLVSMPVAFTQNGSFFQRAQALEFAALIAIGASTLKQGKPTLCNGANLAYTKEAFYAVNGFEGIDGIASGDDELLMHKIAKAFPGRLKFLKHKECIAYTQPAENMKDFISQRRRWVSKSGKYAAKRITLILVLAFLFNLTLFTTFIIHFFYHAFFMMFILTVSVKLLAEYRFYKNVIPFFGDRKLMRVFIPGSLSHVVYALFIGIYANFGRYNWKGRRVK